MINKKNSYSKYLTYFVFLILFIIGFFTYQDYGIGIDDKFHRLNGFYWLDYLLSFSNLEELKKAASLKLLSISDYTLPSIEYYNSYSIVFDVPAALLEIIFKKTDAKDFYEFKHLLNFLFFYVGCFFFYLILDVRFNKTTSFLGLILFIISPRIYGESFYNMKDIIYLTFMAGAYYFCLRCFLFMSIKNLIGLAIFSAICIQIRIFGLIIPLSFICFYLISLLAKPKDLKDVKKMIFFFLSTAIFTFILWPYLWQEPATNFFKIFQNIIPNVFVLFNGHYINNEFLPYSYVPLWIFISTPILHLFLFIFGIYFLAKRTFNRLLEIREKSISYDLWRGKKEKFDTFLFLNFFVLFTLVVLLNLKLLNSWKHLYFLNFFLVYTCAFYLYILFVKRYLSKTFLLMFTIMSIFTGARMIIYHPYQGLYFNYLITDKFKNKFEIDFTALSARHFFDKILLIENETEQIKIATASWVPLNRTLDIYSDKNKKKIKLVNQKFDSADYIYTNNISEVDKTANDKYNIPKNFKKFYELVIDGAVIYTAYKKELN